MRTDAMAIGRCRWEKMALMADVTSLNKLKPQSSEAAGVVAAPEPGAARKKASRGRRWVIRSAAAAAAATAAGTAWWFLRPTALPPGFAMGNGRIEATEVDVAAKIPGRVREI